MKNKQRYITGSVTILAAAATAHLMQRNAGADTAKLAAPPPAPTEIAVPAPQLASRATVTLATAAVVPDAPVTVENVIQVSRSAVSAVRDMPSPPDEAMAPRQLPRVGESLQARMAATAATGTEPAVAAPQPKRNAFGLTCGLVLTASPAPAAMVDLTLTAPCRGGEIVTVAHGPMVFTARMDDMGMFRGTVPALAVEAIYDVSFADGAAATADVMVPDLSFVDRVVLQWQGRSGLQIHALEFGADYGSAGHVWQGAARDVDSASRSGGGFLTRLGDGAGDAARTAEVYTFPDNTRNRDGVVRLSIEAEVTAFNCDREITGQTMQRGAGGAMTPVTLTLSMPDCTAVGEYLVLKNLLQDLKIASN